MALDLTQIFRTCANAALWHFNLVKNTFDVEKSLSLSSDNLVGKFLFRVLSFGTLAVLVSRIMEPLPGGDVLQKVNLSALRVGLFLLVTSVPASVGYYLVGQVWRSWRMSYRKWFVLNGLISLNLTFICMLVAFGIQWAIIVGGASIENAVAYIFLEKESDGDRRFEKYAGAIVFAVTVMNFARSLQNSKRSAVGFLFLSMLVTIGLILASRYLVVRTADKFPELKEFFDLVVQTAASTFRILEVLI